MIPRHASVIICDEMLYSLSGKFNFLGAYPSDLTIPADPTTSAQLIFYFVIEADVTDPYKSLRMEITLPEQTPVVQQMPVIPTVPVHPDRPRWTLRWPIVIPQPTLRPGRIVAKVIHESGELIAGTPWIVLTGQPKQPLVS
jgi:hypothetical protein